jgi:hypothetical protein
MQSPGNRKVSFTGPPLDSPSTRNPIKPSITPPPPRSQPSFVKALNNETIDQLTFAANNPPPSSSNNNNNRKLNPSHSSSSDKDEPLSPRRLKKVDKSFPPPKRDARFSFHDSQQDQVQVDSSSVQQPRLLRSSRDIINEIAINEGNTALGAAGAGGVAGGVNMRPRMSNVSPIFRPPNNININPNAPLPTVDEILKNTDGTSYLFLAPVSFICSCSLCITLFQAFHHILFSCHHLISPL